MRKSVETQITSRLVENNTKIESDHNQSPFDNNASTPSVDGSKQVIANPKLMHQGDFMSIQGDHIQP